MTQQTKQRTTTEQETEVTQDLPEAPADREQKLAEIDEILDDLDDVLDENATVAEEIALARTVEQALTDLDKQAEEQNLPCEDCREAGYCKYRNTDGLLNYTALFLD